MNIFYYKIVSGSAVGLEVLGENLSEYLHLATLHWSRSFFNALYAFSFNSEYIEDLIESLHALTSRKIACSYKENCENFEKIEAYLNTKQEELEKTIVNEGFELEAWAFNTNNRKTIKILLNFIKEHTKLLFDMPFGDLNKTIQYYINDQIQRSQKSFKVPLLPLDSLGINIPELSNLSKYAVGIYGHFLGRIALKENFKSLFSSLSNKQLFLQYTKTSIKDLLYTKGSSLKYLPAHAIVALHHKKALILVIRGTKSGFDCLSDLECEYASFCCKGVHGKVHAGILKSAENLSNLVKNKIKEFLNQFGYFNVIVVGHSLGAGCAALVTLL